MDIKKKKSAKEHEKKAFALFSYKGKRGDVYDRK